MSFRSIILVSVVARLVCPVDVSAQVRVNPTGVNVNTQGATTVFLTYGGLRNQIPIEAFWCGALIPAAPARGSRCTWLLSSGAVAAAWEQPGSAVAAARVTH